MFLPERSLQARGRPRATPGAFLGFSRAAIQWRLNDYLPAYSPNINLIERVWKCVKREAMANRTHETFADFRAAIDRALDELGTTHMSEMATLRTHRFETLNLTRGAYTRPIFPPASEIYRRRFFAHCSSTFSRPNCTHIAFILNRTASVSTLRLDSKNSQIFRPTAYRLIARSVASPDRHEREISTGGFPKPEYHSGLRVGRECGDDSSEYCGQSVGRDRFVLRMPYSMTNRDAGVLT